MRWACLSHFQEFEFVPPALRQNFEKKTYLGFFSHSNSFMLTSAISIQKYVTSHYQLTFKKVKPIKSFKKSFGFLSWTRIHFCEDFVLFRFLSAPKICLIINFYLIAQTSSYCLCLIIFFEGTRKWLFTAKNPFFVPQKQIIRPMLVMGRSFSYKILKISLGCLAFPFSSIALEAESLFRLVLNMEPNWKYLLRFPHL